MSNITEHTPWVAKKTPYDDDFSHEIKEGENVICCIYRGSEKHVNLIQAAPEILKSLAMMTALCRVKYGNLVPDVDAEILKAEAVITKATGEKEGAK